MKVKNKQTIKLELIIFSPKKKKNLNFSKTDFLRYLFNLYLYRYCHHLYRFGNHVLEQNLYWMS